MINLNTSVGNITLILHSLKEIHNELSSKQCEHNAIQKQRRYSGPNPKPHNWQAIKLITEIPSIQVFQKSLPLGLVLEKSTPVSKNFN